MPVMAIETRIGRSPSKFLTTDSLLSNVNNSTDAGSTSRASSTEPPSPTSPTSPTLPWELVSKSRTATPQSPRDYETPFEAIVKNTFLHFPDEDEEPASMRRNASAPALLTELEDSMPEDADPESRMSPEEIAAAKEAQEIAHFAGNCRPCLYFALKSDSCRKGSDCTFCHSCTKAEIMGRRKEQKSIARAALLAERSEGGEKRTRRRRGQKPLQRAPMEELPLPVSRIAAPYRSGPAIRVAPRLPVGESPAIRRATKTPIGMVTLTLSAFVPR